jgi:hypothetical protein
LVAFVGDPVVYKGLAIAKARDDAASTSKVGRQIVIIPRLYCDHVEALSVWFGEHVRLYAATLPVRFLEQLGMLRQDRDGFHIGSFEGSLDSVAANIREAADSVEYYQSR